MSVRRAADSDLEAIHPLLEQLMPAPAHRRRAMWHEARTHQGYAAWVAEVDGKPVGFLDLYISPDTAHGNNVGVVNNLVIDERFRGRGLGESLLREAIEHSERRDVAELHVWTDFDNHAAIGLYKKLGFAERALLMELEVRREGRPLKVTGRDSG